MARTFTITCAAGTIRLAGQARGECSFTVTNTSSGMVRAHPTVIALDGRAQNWFGVVGNPVRELAPGQTVQITVTILPAGAPPGRYIFRLDVLPAEGGERSAGPEACVELTSEAPPLPVGSKPFPWWWLVIAATALVIIAVVMWLVLRGGGTDPAQPSSAEEPVSTDQPTPTDKTLPGPATSAPVKDAVRPLVEKWLVAFRAKDTKTLTALTAAPAVIDEQRVNDAASIAKSYTRLLEAARTAATRRLTTVKPAAPVIRRVREVGATLASEAKKLGLTSDDHVVGVTIEESGFELVLFIRQGSSPRISGVAR